MIALHVLHSRDLPRFRALLHLLATRVDFVHTLARSFIRLDINGACVTSRTWGTGPSPRSLIIMGSKIPRVGENKNETRIDEKTCCHCSFVVVPVRDWVECNMLQFSRLDDLQNIGFDRLKIVLFGPVFLKLREARRKETFHTITDFTLSHVLSRNSK